jgi:hypothetical protein
MPLVKAYAGNIPVQLIAYLHFFSCSEIQAVIQGKLKDFPHHAIYLSQTLMLT